jgi:DNA invertase Pin-like site-specific DNA recombinase
MFQMMGVFAEFERAMIRERVRAGLARARASGVRLGRPRVGADKETRIRELLHQGVGIVRIGKTVGCGTGVVQRIRADLIASMASARESRADRESALTP